MQLAKSPVPTGPPSEAPEDEPEDDPEDEPEDELPDDEPDDEPPDDELEDDELEDEPPEDEPEEDPEDEPEEPEDVPEEEDPEEEPDPLEVAASSPLGGWFVELPHAPMDGATANTKAQPTIEIRTMTILRVRVATSSLRVRPRWPHSSDTSRPIAVAGRSNAPIGRPHVSRMNNPG